LALCSGADVIIKQPKKAKHTHFLIPPTKNGVPKSEMFFFSVQTRRLQESLYLCTHLGSYSSLAYSNGELPQVIVSYSSRQWETHAFSDFGGKMGFWAITLVPDMLEGQARALIDAGDCLDSKKSLNKNFGPLDWHPGPVKVGQKNKNTPILRAPPRRTPYPNKKNFV